jgi:hypothetical protein
MNAKLYLRDDGEYEIVTPTLKYRLDRLDLIEKDFPLTERLPFNDDAILTGGNVIEKHAFDSFDQLLAETDTSTLQRARTYLSTNADSFEMNRVSREGGSTLERVVFHDIWTFLFLSRLSLLFPIALTSTEHRPLHFTISYRPALWIIRDRLARYLLTRASDYPAGTWNNPASNRAPWTHQRDSLNEMIHNHKQGKRGHFIWIG